MATYEGNFVVAAALAAETGPDRCAYGMRLPRPSTKLDERRKSRKAEPPSAFTMVDRDGSRT
jgi:hypothetical protein